MHCYYVDYESDLVELGDFTKEEAVELFRTHAATEGKNELFIGLSRNELDFVEISYVKENTFMIHTDRLIKPVGLIGRMFSRRHIDIQVIGMRRVENLLVAYITKSRSDFEETLLHI